MIKEIRNFLVKEESLEEFLGLEKRITNGSYNSNLICELKKEMFTDKKMNYGDTVTIELKEHCYSGFIQHAFTYEFSIYDDVKSKFILKKIDSEYHKDLETRLNKNNH